MAHKQIARLTEEEIDLLQRGQTDVDILTGYFFRKPGANRGWMFDYNFDPLGAWQKTVHHAKQRRIVVIGGFGSGKTRGIAISACVWGMSVPEFAFLNAAPNAWQSELMYKFIIQATSGTPFERLIYAAPKGPYPSIELKFWIRDFLMHSTLEFMSVDKNANQILSWEGDWVNIEEAGTLDDLGGTIMNLGTRLRGSVSDRARLGRMSMISNSWDNPELWYRYDMAVALPEDYLSLTVSTRHNHNVSEQDLKMMLKDIPEDEWDQFIEGSRPQGRGHYFTVVKVHACEDKTYGDYILAHVNAKTPGFSVQGVYGAGVVYFQTPRVDRHIYMLIGDPGTGAAPDRNAPALMVWDVTDFPKMKASLAAVWWGSGHGSITPFLRWMFRLMAFYNPIKTYVDSTGPQKNTNELVNLFMTSERSDPEKVSEFLDGVSLEHVTNKIVEGLDFSGGRKPAYLIAGRLMIEAGLMIWPEFFAGLRSQLTNYDPDKDRVNQPKFPQDLVAAFCMGAYAIRDFFRLDPKNAAGPMGGSADDAPDHLDNRAARYTPDIRKQRIPRPELQ